MPHRPLTAPPAHLVRSVLGVVGLVVVAAVVAVALMGPEPAESWETSDTRAVDPEELWRAVDIPGLDHPFTPLFERAAAESGVDVEVLKALAWRESTWDPRAVSPVGAVGVAQLMPSTSDHVAERFLDEPDLDPRDPADNLRMSAAYLAWLTGRYDGDVRQALWAYVQGHASVERDGPYRISQAYADDVMRMAEGLRSR